MDDHGDEPVVSIIGINRAVELPMVYDGANAVRRMMNLSSSFDGCGILQRKSRYIRPAFSTIFRKGSSIERARIRIPAV